MRGGAAEGARGALCPKCATARRNTEHWQVLSNPVMRKIVYVVKNVCRLDFC